MENISFHVANGSINKEFLHAIMTAVIDEEMDSEELKLKLFQAINNDNK